jgi:hypothetical protein
MRPQPGTMVYWRYRATGGGYHFGYVTYVTYVGQLCRMGRWNGDTMGGPLVDPFEIEWRPHS